MRAAWLRSRLHVRRLVVVGARYVTLRFPVDDARRILHALESADAVMSDLAEADAADPGAPGGALDSLNLAIMGLSAIHGALVLALDPPPRCGHSACRQHWIDSGERACAAPNAGESRTGEQG